MSHRHRLAAALAAVAAAVFVSPGLATAQEAAEPGDELDDILRDADRATAGRRDTRPRADGEPAPAEPAPSFSGYTDRAIQTLNAFNPRMTVFGDFVGRLSVSTAELEEDDRVALREIEIDLRADVDPYATAVLIAAFEEEDPGEFAVAVEEGYVTFETLPWNFKARVGRYLVPFGQLARLHTHDLPWTERPLPILDFLGEEGFGEHGIELTWLAPGIPPSLGALTLGAHLLNGENEAILAGDDSDDPAWLGRAEYFVDISPSTFLIFGSSYLFGFNDEDRDQETHLLGADFVAKWFPDNTLSVVLQGEMFYLERDVIDVDGFRDEEYGLGAIGVVQVQPLQRWFLGLRYDYSNYDEQVEDSEQYAIGGYVSFYTTEFLRLRVGYEHRERSTTGGGNPDLDTLLFQVTFVFGSHPVEPYWFNR